jgi:hypothetical protein
MDDQDCFSYYTVKRNRSAPEGRRAIKERSLKFQSAESSPMTTLFIFNALKEMSSREVTRQYYRFQRHEIWFVTEDREE